MLDIAALKHVTSDRIGKNRKLLPKREQSRERQEKLLHEQQHVRPISRDYLTLAIEGMNVNHIVSYPLTPSTCLVWLT